VKAIMVVGTTSHAGKSLLTAALCRMLSRKGYRVSPFKGQNMALNAYVTQEGGEMGHAQAVQAWAAGIEPRVAMNPILLKPQGDMTSQVILRGQVVGQVGAAEYYRDYFDRGWEAICQSLAELSQDFDWLVCEGAGSPAEINLKHRDLTNMRVASYLNASTVLVADIDRGGVFAHIVGTLELLEPQERALIKGLVINKFRGQRSLLDSGLTWLEERTGIPVLGVIPWLDLALPAEDSLDLFERPSRNSYRDLNITVIRLPRIANFTDFDPLAAEPTVSINYLYPQQSLGRPDAVILPGSKTTIPDLQVLQQSGMAAQIQGFVADGGTLLGICGGMQMLGEWLSDPEGSEGVAGEFPGLGLLPLRTRMSGEKITQQRRGIAHFPIPGLTVTGYEIHQGQTQTLAPVQALFEPPDLGYVDGNQRVWGSYLHGLFENGPWRRAWLNQLREQKQLPPLPIQISDYAEQRSQLLDQLTDEIAAHLDIGPLL
jgi:adenosylcobyric acid synthase